jgi:hypothetical protein
MSTYARIKDGFAVDVIVTPPELVDRFHPEWLSRHTFIIVPDGTKHGAKDNGNGTFTNTAVPAVVTVNAVLGADAFIDYMTAQLGNGAVGDARYGTILLAADSSIDPTVVTKFAKFKATPGDRAATKKLLNAMKTAAIPAGAVVTNAEVNAIDNNWPQV